MFLPFRAAYTVAGMVEVGAPICMRTPAIRAVSLSREQPEPSAFFFVLLLFFCGQCV